MIKIAAKVQLYFGVAKCFDEEIDYIFLLICGGYSSPPANQCYYSVYNQQSPTQHTMARAVTLRCKVTTFFYDKRRIFKEFYRMV